MSCIIFYRLYAIS